MDAGGAVSVYYGAAGPSLTLAECFGHLGQTDPARDAAAEALTCAESTGDRAEICYSHAFVGWLAGLVGDTAQAEQQFTTAEAVKVRVQVAIISLKPDGPVAGSAPGRQSNR